MSKNSEQTANSSTNKRVRVLVERIYWKNGRGKGSSVKNHHSLVADLGFDSLEVLELVTAIEKEFSITIPDDDLRVELFDSVGSIMACVDRLVKGKAN